MPVSSGRRAELRSVAAGSLGAGTPLGGGVAFFSGPAGATGGSLLEGEEVRLGGRPALEPVGRAGLFPRPPGRGGLRFAIPSHPRVTVTQTKLFIGRSSLGSKQHYDARPRFPRRKMARRALNVAGPTKLKMSRRPMAGMNSAVIFAAGLAVVATSPSPV